MKLFVCPYETRLKFLANENIPSVCVAMLESAGHDVLHVARACPGASDTDISQKMLAPKLICNIMALNHKG